MPPISTVGLQYSSIFLTHYCTLLAAANQNWLMRHGTSNRISMIVMLTNTRKWIEFTKHQWTDFTKHHVKWQLSLQGYTPHPSPHLLDPRLSVSFDVGALAIPCSSASCYPLSISRSQFLIMHRYSRRENNHKIVETRLCHRD